uniref:U1 protein n=1 Tax=Pea necrotic yellow dwarf virus TaxID=753670 RepID=A0A2D2PYM4_9VIRU|nr:U1 protein [Pea necrotic yellow dwarf virus]
MVQGFFKLGDIPIVDEGTEALISDSRKRQGMFCSDEKLVKKLQVINIKVEDISYGIDDDDARIRFKFRLNYRFRKQLGIVLLGVRMTAITRLETPSAKSVQSLLQRRLNGICDSNEVISIFMFFNNIGQLLNSTKWIHHVDEVNPICTLYSMED